MIDITSVEHMTPPYPTRGSLEYFNVKKEMLESFLNVSLDELMNMRNDIMPSHIELCKMTAYCDLKDSKDGFSVNGRSSMYNISGVKIRMLPEYEKYRKEFLKMSHEEFDALPDMDINDNTRAKIHLINNLIYNLRSQDRT